MRRWNCVCMGAPLRPCRGVEYRHRVARKVDEQLLGGPMRLAHGRRDGFKVTTIPMVESQIERDDKIAAFKILGISNIDSVSIRMPTGCSFARPVSE